MKHLPRLNPGFVIIRTDDGQKVEYAVDIDDGVLGLESYVMMGGVAIEVIASFSEQTLDTSAFFKISEMWDRQSQEPEYYPSKDLLVFYKALPAKRYPNLECHPAYCVTTGAVYGSIDQELHCVPEHIADIPWSVWSDAAKARLREVLGWIPPDLTDCS
jgi:hypothetical protein